MRRPVVVKCGGAVAAEAAASVLELAGAAPVCVVHGAGPQITAEMAKRDLVVQFIGGRRVTSDEVVEIVRSALAAVNGDLSAALGRRAVGLMGDEIGLRARLVPRLGFVGDPLPSRPPAVLAALAEGRIPVVAPLAAGPLNVNADDMAAALAAGLDAQRLVFLTDVPGLLRDGRLVRSIEAESAERLLASGELAGGILPKLRAAVTAARLGVETTIGETAVLA